MYERTDERIDSRSDRTPRRPSRCSDGQCGHAPSRLATCLTSLGGCYLSRVYVTSSESLDSAAESADWRNISFQCLSFQRVFLRLSTSEKSNVGCYLPYWNLWSTCCRLSITTTGILRCSFVFPPPRSPEHVLYRPISWVLTVQKDTSERAKPNSGYCASIVSSFPSLM